MRAPARIGRFPGALPALAANRRPNGAGLTGRVRVDGKFFAVGSRRFNFRGVTYGTFAPRGDGAQFPERPQIRRDFRRMRDAGFTVVRTYTLPSDDLIEAAAENGLRILPNTFYPDWRYLLGGSRRQRLRLARDGSSGLNSASEISSWLISARSLRAR